MSNFGRAGLGTDWFTTQRSSFLREAYGKEEIYINRWYEQSKSGAVNNASAYDKAPESSVKYDSEAGPAEEPPRRKAAEAPAADSSAGPDDDVAAWTSYRGSFKDPQILGICKLERSFMRPKTDRGDFQEQCIKQGTTLTKTKGGGGH
mmetsp:Transcript_39352/g.47695  ORF Transcript_39352/g.47695 Transcript_39352/m.47695 type:complete len:148 (+) Transcript_39352:105-548(+)|eukprot:CAMPEP_0197861246 /NCGR_PEP_ID=MMETSP1438-20131217/37160_1 /TAXON_ID=1461541 /ORGANISM="Pterosperma sp., Strain CCMP1384" /LENGTH=147 /DNA_ID=CAMNT_0043478353 /DNA_START=109 /DNA_END=552 /DNA_ORIENTATION=+